MSTQTQEYKTDWMSVGEKYIKTEADKARVINEADGFTWQSTKGGLSVGMCPGLAIKEIIQELKIPKVDEIAIGGGFGLSVEPSASYGFYGIQGHYAKGLKVQIFVLDNGCECTILFARVYESKS